MNKQTRARIMKKASETVKARHRGSKPVGSSTASSSSPASPASPVRTVKKEETAPAAGAQAIASGDGHAHLPKLPRLPSNRVRKARAQQPCACGCGNLTGRSWAPGHDARARGWAIRIERAICTLAEVPANEQNGARLMLNLRKVGGSLKADIKLVAKVDEGQQDKEAAS